MATFLATALFMGGLMAIMAVGVMFGGNPLKGSCGGIPGKSCGCSDEKKQACETKHDELIAEAMRGIEGGTPRVGRWQGEIQTGPSGS